MKKNLQTLHAIVTVKNRSISQVGPDGSRVQCSIDDLDLLGDLGNGTCGHVVKMRHKQTGNVIAVKQMRRTGNR